MGGELIHAARRKSRHGGSNRRVWRPRQRRVRIIKARNVLSRLTLLVLLVNLNPEIGNSELRSSWFSSVRHDNGKILNRPRYCLINFACKHSSMPFCYSTTYNANRSHISCGADLVRVICPQCAPQQSRPPYNLSSEMSEVIWFSSASAWPNNVYHQYNTFWRLFLMQDLVQFLGPWVIWTKRTFKQM